MGSEVKHTPTDFIAEAITEAFGPRCPEYLEGCPACDAWQQRDDTLAALVEAREIAKLAATLTGNRGDDDYVACRAARIEAAISRATGATP